ncbi:hypothetical protein SLEP1_g51924 [Rubroshorea leprosula]|uniref:Uncharacterized protein n=1 Tax=Rubroshorea leprosula TaxID=152421 RepID=A0AAV5M4P3_9ROSI|nr:hypothetical protein SLEP1_g51924 [Rubroshorea leprosula]
MVLPPSPSTRIFPQKNKVSETRLTSSTSVRSLDLIDKRALNSTEISCSVVPSETNVVETDDFLSKFSLSGSFLLEDSNENSSAREVSCHSTVDVAGFVSHTVLPSIRISATSSGEKASETELFPSVFSSELIGPSDDSNDVVSISSMETIAFCDNAKLEDS